MVLLVFEREKELLPGAIPSIRTMLLFQHGLWFPGCTRLFNRMLWGKPQAVASER